LDELGELRDDGSLAWVEKDIVGVRNSAEEVEASTGFLKFVNVFDPDKLVIGQLPENLIGGRHLKFFSPGVRDI
jgi:hypothetical protein